MSRRAKKQVLPLAVSRNDLLTAIGQTWDDDRFLVCSSADEKADFRNGSCPFNSQFISKPILLEAVENSPFEEFPYTHGAPSDSIIISNHMVCWRGSINHAQFFPVPEDIEGFHHIVATGTRHYDIYFKIDEAESTITFCLGKERRVLELVPHSSWAWKLEARRLLTNDISHLERSFTDEFWSQHVVKIGRSALGIKDLI